MHLVMQYLKYIKCYSQAFRADYIDWCLPLFGSDYGFNEFDNYTCSFLAANDNMYFVNHTAGIWEKEECCLFEGVNCWFNHDHIFTYAHV